MSDLPPPPPPPGAPGYPAGPPTAPPTGAPAPPPWAPPGGETPVPDDDPGSPGRRRRVGPALAIAAVIALLAATVVVITRGDTRDTAVDDPATTTAPAPDGGEENPATSSPAVDDIPPVSEDEFLALVEELKAYVAEARGLEFLEPVVVELADDEEFEARLLEDFEDDVDEIEDAEVFYRAMGLIDPDTDLLEELKAIYAQGVLGFYDTETDDLVVRGRTPTPYVRQTIVHELVHALDDQHFELFREQYDDRKDEIATGFSAVVEGNARRIEERWLGEQSEDVRAAARAEERAFGEAIDVDAFPEILLFEIGAPYELGQVLVDSIVGDAGERGVDAAIADPPTTSEQVLFPQLYAEREPRIEVPRPPADGEVVDDGVVGALFWFGLFVTGDSEVGQRDAIRAVQGWGGDWGVTWQDGDADCVRVDIVGDTQQDTDEIEDALVTWAETSVAAEVSVVDGRVRLESCVLGAGRTPPQV